MASKGAASLLITTSLPALSFLLTPVVEGERRKKATKIEKLAGMSYFIFLVNPPKNCKHFFCCLVVMRIESAAFTVFQIVKSPTYKQNKPHIDMHKGNST
jgi:hypothetical protein